MRERGGGSGGDDSISQPSASRPPLRQIHPEEIIRSDPIYRAYQNLSTEDIIRSLGPGQPNALTIKLDGRIMNGNTRIQVLKERGYNIDSLPAEILRDDLELLS